MDNKSLKTGKKKNGHKLLCDCHICENMKNKAKRGGYEEEAKKEAIQKAGGSGKKNGHKPDCNCPICKNMKNCKNKGKGKKSKTKKVRGGDLKYSDIESEDGETDDGDGNITDIIENQKNDNNLEESANVKEYDELNGGKLKKRKGNGHKANCCCPICKNIKKHKSKGKGKKNKTKKLRW
jgi:hypothetical protein